MLVTRRIVLLCVVSLSFSLFFQATHATAQSSPKTLPDSTSSVDQRPTGNNADGREAVEKLMQALGGTAKVHAVKSLRQIFTMEQQGQKTTVDQSIVYPDKQVRSISLPQGERIRVVVTPTAAFMTKGALVHDLSLNLRTSSNAALKHDFLNVLQHLNNPKYTFSANTGHKLGSIGATVVDVNADGTQTRWWIGPDGKLLQEQCSVTTQAGPKTLLMKYSDWKNFDGLKYPAKYEVFDKAGQLELSMILVRMTVNAAVDPELFEKPRQ